MNQFAGKTALILFIALVLGACAGAEKKPAELIAWPPPPLAERVRYSHEFLVPGDLDIKPSWFSRFINWISGDQPWPLVRPYGIAANDRLIVVADPGSRAVMLYNIADKSHKRITSAGKDRFQSPVGVAVSDTRIYVADSVLARLYLFTVEGEYVASIDGFERPTGLAYHARLNQLYVSDTLAHRIVVLDNRGKRLFDFGKRKKAKAGFNYPSHLALHGDRLYVNDTMNFRVQVFDLKGNFVTQFGKHGDISGHFSQPKGIGVDAYGHIYVADSIFHKVQIFDIKGRFLLDFGKQGRRPGEFWMPAGIYIHKNRIYVADSYNRRVQVFDYTYKEKQG